MEFVGGYAAWERLSQNARAYEDVLLVMSGRSKAANIRERQRKAGF